MLTDSQPPRIPWKEAGWTERQAAAHLLDRFAFGARPGDVDRVVAMGLERWWAAQLAGGLPELALERRLAGLRSLSMSAVEIAKTYPNPGLVAIQALRARGGSAEPMTAEPNPEAMGEADGRALGREVLGRDALRYAREQGYRSQRELLGELLTQKLYRAVYAENQVREVLADFWGNHFYVSLADRDTHAYVTAYERDAIRPHVLGRFRTLLGATARHPAMLVYLDNARSVANEGMSTTLEVRMPMLAQERANPRRQRPRGLNENYARELLELHTLGVDGGYTQQDVVDVARAFTGWTTLPPGRLDGALAGRVERASRGGRLGFVVDGLFVFRADAHDAGAKKVLGSVLPAGRAMEDGEQVLDLLSRHPATARHLARKLAIRFVADEPPSALVERLARVYESTQGDLAAVMNALVASPELWLPDARRAKIKSPFELAASALRATAAELLEPRAVLEWIARMGQPLYLYQAPTGYPDRASQWVNTGALLARMNFGLQLAAGRVAGARLDLPALDGGKEPESRTAALEQYFELLLPGREAGETLRLLRSVIEDPELAKKVEAATPKPAGEAEDPYGPLFRREGDPAEDPDESPLGRLFRGRPRWPVTSDPPTPLEQVVGVLLGSPEFQRR